ncbi:MAG TPA: Fe-S protein assembly co-chaperone HscB [Polyangiaceae bacterium]|nr:Fe-S protein assembly co-chaperone HscB [Polyangiaceae bacterium]
MNPFAVLGIPARFDVDLASVEKQHRELSRALHPDRFAAATPSERQAALGKAVEVNEAWRIVRDTIRRAEALLVLNGVDVTEEGSPTADLEFLNEMLEQREALDDAKRAKDLEAVLKLGRAIEAKSKAVEAVLTEGFAREDYASLARKVGELRFFRRFLDEVSAIEDELAA